MKNGKVFFRKNYGTFTYGGTDTVRDNSVYDIASVTKITASALALMDLQSRKKFNPDFELSYYLPELCGTNKEEIKISEMLAHQSGLPAWIPYYQFTLTKQNEWKRGFYNKQVSAKFPTQVARDMFVVTGFSDSIYRRIIKCKLEKKGEYVYSDLGYYFVKRIVEKQNNESFDAYLDKKFYKRLGLTMFGFNPLKRGIPDSIIAPTEHDTKFRKQLIRGYVHDQGAALMGGVGGHAGLFGNADELAVIMQLFLQKGTYSGEHFLDSNVVKQYAFLAPFSPKNRRGLCFDKPEIDAKKESPVTRECSPQSFGHSGFTGTFVWADPANGLVFVFLSNRVYPNADDNKLAKSGIRGKIHRVLYEICSEQDKRYVLRKAGEDLTKADF